MDRTVDVLIVLASLRAEGTPRMALDLCRIWRGRGIRPAVFELGRGPAELRETFRAQDIPVATWTSEDKGYRRYLDLVHGGFRVCRQYRPRAVLSMPFGIHSFLAVGARLAGVPRVCAHVGNPPVPGSMSVSSMAKARRIAQVGYPFTFRLICCSRYVQQAVVENMGVPTKVTDVIYNGTGLETFASVKCRLTSERPESRRSWRIGMVATLEAHKDQDTLIAAAALLKEQGIPLEVRLIGEGSRRAVLERLIATLKAPVTLVGACVDVARQLAELDMFAFSTTDREGLGIALIEAMAAGLPVVASDVPACREVLDDGALGIAEQFADAADQLVVGLDPARSGMEEAFQRVPGLRVVKGPARNHRAALRFMTKAFGLEQPDGVIVYAFGVTHLIAAVAARRAGVRPVLVSAGNPPPAGKGRLKWRLVLLASRILGVSIQACSRLVYNELKALGCGLPRGSGVIHNGCDVGSIAKRAAAARAGRRENGPFVIGMVARLDAIKDQATLIRGFARLVRMDRNRPFELWLVGDGPLRPALEALAQHEGVADSVRFLGSRSDVPELLGQMDVYVFSTTRDEGFGIALVEAMAAGLPVVASDVPACREVLIDGEAGILVAAGNGEALSEALSSLVDASDRRRHWARAAQEVASRHYDIRLCADRWRAMLAGRDTGLKPHPVGCR